MRARRRRRVKCAMPLRWGVVLIVEVISIMVYIKTMGAISLVGLFVVAGSIVRTNPYAVVGVVGLASLILVIAALYVVLFLTRHTHNHIAAIQHNRLDLAIKATELELHRAKLRTETLMHHNPQHLLLQHTESGVSALYTPVQQQVGTVKVSEVPQEQLAIEAPVPSPVALLTSNHTDELIIGVDREGYAVTKPYSNTLIAGLSGFGKTSTMAWLIGQVVYKGAKLAVLDPHRAASDDSLYSAIRPYEYAFAYPVGYNTETMLDVVRNVRAEIDSRIAGSGVTQPILIVVDELNALLLGLNSKKDTAEYQLAYELKELLYLTNIAARKYGVRAIAALQDVSANSTGGTSSLRDTFGLRLYHALRGKQADMLGVSEYKNTLKALRVGEVLLDFASDVEMVKVRVPYVSSRDVEQIALMSR